MTNRHSSCLSEPLHPDAISLFQVEFVEKNCSRCLVAADDIEPEEAICVEALKQIGLRRNALSAPGTHDCRADRPALCSAHRGCIEVLIHGAPYHSNLTRLTLFLKC